MVAGLEHDMGAELLFLRRRTGAAAVLAMVVALARPAAAYDLATGEVYLFNLMSCGQFAQDRKLPKGRGTHGADALYVAGWLSAYNALVPGGVVRPDTMIYNTLLWLDRYCLDHPFGTMQDGLMRLGREWAAGAAGGAAGK